MSDPCVTALLDYAQSKELIYPCDRRYAANLIIDAIGAKAYKPESAEQMPLEAILDGLCETARKNGVLTDNSVTSRDLLTSRIMGLLTPPPHEVISRFNELYRVSPERATDYFYAVSRDSDYIRTYRVVKDLKWIYRNEYGDLDITINLSKPEKDPRAIAAAKLAPPAGYPLCALCAENEGFSGSLTQPARENLRVVPVEMNGESWFLQYSPYVYYDEHCIVLNASHTPMKIDRASFVKLLDFVRAFPHYFVGSNADLPIVGGSILSHDHLQGGRHEFAMARAEIEYKVEFPGFSGSSGMECGIVRWPMSVIRLRSDNTDDIIELSDRILQAWRSYSDPDAGVLAVTDGVPHNTITPIARKSAKDGKYEMDLVLRNNITTPEHPLGLFHPHANLHNIKKENIGLIEVMGLAVLPARLESEMKLLKMLLLTGASVRDNETVDKHADWVARFMGRYSSVNQDNVDDVIRSEIGRTFTRVLEDAGVYKTTPQSRSAFLRFCQSVK